LNTASLKAFTMDLYAAKGQQPSKWAWARIGALLLFLLTGVLLVTSLSSLKTQNSEAGAISQVHHSQLS
jgi:bacteriorhodopsin